MTIKAQWFTAAVLILSACGLGGSTGEEQKPVAEIIGDVVAVRCAGCHGAGKLEAPLGPWFGPQMVERVLEKTMPPGQPSKATPALVDDPRLTTAELQAFVDWQAAGYPKFLTGQADAALAWPFDVELRPDQPYTPPDPAPSEPQDEYHCFLLDNAAISGRWITGYQWQVDQRAEMHHISVDVVGKEVVARRKDSPHWPCGSGLEISQTSLGNGGVMNSTPIEFQPEEGVQVPAGGGLVLVMHYLRGLHQPDRSGIRLRLAGSSPSRHIEQVYVNGPGEVPCYTGLAPYPSPCSREASFQHVPDGWTPELLHQTSDATLAACGQSWASYVGDIDFKANPVLVRSHCSALIGVEGLVRTGHLHAHTYTIGGQVLVRHADGRSTVIVDYGDPKYSWGWEFIAQIAKPVYVVPGDLIEVQCTFKNTPDNQWGINGPALNGRPVPPLQPVALIKGLGTRDGEMCYGSIQVSVKK